MREPSSGRQVSFPGARDLVQTCCTASEGPAELVFARDTGESANSRVAFLIGASQGWYDLANTNGVAQVV